MSKRRRYKPEEKLAAVLEYVNGNKSYTEAGKVVGVDSWTVRDWVFQYRLLSKLGRPNLYCGFPSVTRKLLHTEKPRVSI